MTFGNGIDRNERYDYMIQFYKVFRLADDSEEYGPNAGKFIVVSGNDDESEHSGPMSEADAMMLARCLNALRETNDVLNHYFMVGDDEDGGDETHDLIRDILKGITK
jgi:hypothetical protein